jgi:LysM repeat protein
VASTDLTTVLNECIDRLTQGETVEDCLRAYPQYAMELRPMLEAGLLTKRAAIAPLEIQIAKERARANFQRAIRTTPVRRAYPLRQALALAAMLLIGFIVIGGGLTAAAQNSLPGDILYGFKLFGESLQRASSGNIGELDTLFNNRRLDEVRQLLAASRAAEVTFIGEVQIIEGNTWLIANLPVEVIASLPGIEPIQIGDTVRVTATTTTSRQLIATKIELIADTVMPTATATLTPTVTPSNTVTITPSATVSETLGATVTATASASATQTPSPTRTVTASPTPTATVTASPTSSATRTATRPVQTATPTVCAPQRPSGWLDYQIRAGDSLSALAAASGTTITELQAVNCILEPNRLVVGQLIFLPRSITVNPPGNDNNSGNDNGPSGDNQNNSADNQGDDSGGNGSDNSNDNTDDDDNGNNDNTNDDDD